MAQKKLLDANDQDAETWMADLGPSANHSTIIKQSGWIIRVWKMECSHVLTGFQCLRSPYFLERRSTHCSYGSEKQPCHLSTWCLIMMENKNWCSTNPSRLHSKPFGAAFLRLFVFYWIRWGNLNSMSKPIGKWSMHPLLLDVSVSPELQRSA